MPSPFRRENCIFFGEICGPKDLQQIASQIIGHVGGPLTVPILLECILFGRAANFSAGQQTFRSGRKLFGLAANYSARQQTVRSRIKLFGRASNFPVGHQTFRSGFAVCIIYHRLPTFCRFLLSGFLSFCLPVPPSQFLSKSGEAPISSD